MKKLTPMKRLKNNFNILKEVMHDFEYYTLNKSQSKYIPFPFQQKPRGAKEYKAYTKGVKNDFSLNFTNESLDVSVGFVINYIDLTEPVFNVTIKYGSSNENITSSEVYDFDSFKAKLNHLNSKKNKNAKELIEIINVLFLENSFNLKDYEKKANAEIKEHLGQEYIDYKNVAKSVKKAHSNYLNAQKAAEEELHLTDEYLFVQVKEKELALAKKFLNYKSDEINEKHKISELITVFNSEKSKAGDLWKLQNRLWEMNLKFPKFVKKMIDEINKFRQLKL